MKWLVKNSDKTHIVSTPDTLVSGLPIEIDVNEKKILVKWKESSQTLFLLEKNKNGGFLERPISLRNISISQFSGDTEKSIEIEIAGTNAEHHTAKVSRYAPGQKNRDKAKSSKGATIRSPITGKVLSVKVAEGESVENGATLLTIDAMKMENKFLSTSAGQITKISVKDGDMVSVGIELVSIK